MVLDRGTYSCIGLKCCLVIRPCPVFRYENGDFSIVCSFLACREKCRRRFCERILFEMNSSGPFVCWAFFIRKLQNPKLSGIRICIGKDHYNSCNCINYVSIWSDVHWSVLVSAQRSIGRFSLTIPSIYFENPKIHKSKNSPKVLNADSQSEYFLVKSSAFMDLPLWIQAKLDCQESLGW